MDTGSRSCDYIFISHAHSDHVPQSSKIHVFATKPTDQIMRIRGFKGEITELEFNRPFNLPDATVTLYPAGHILGSAMIYIQTDEGSLLYTGDYRYPPSPVSEGFEIPEQVDIFITEATFSLPIYKWQPQEIIYEKIRTFTLEALKNGDVPAFLAYSLGKTQELMYALAPLGKEILVHKSSYDICQVYRDAGYDIGNYQLPGQEDIKDKILITPSLNNGTNIKDRQSNLLPVYVSGWATLSKKNYSNSTVMFPLSDHIDFFELISLCERLNPGQVLITHTPNPDVVCHYLNERNISALPLESVSIS